VIILQSATTTEDRFFNDNKNQKRPSKVKTFQQWFAKTKANSPDLDLDKAKWEYLQEKYNL
jgi:hypothetical protein